MSVLCPCSQSGFPAILFSAVSFFLVSFFQSASFSSSTNWSAYQHFLQIGSRDHQVDFIGNASYNIGGFIGGHFYTARFRAFTQSHSSHLLVLSASHAV
jgi:hypothetical protein